ncbi:MAG: CpsD/CapB family tyrosine-protein kinase [Phycisphaeraceae bacterium]
MGYIFDALNRAQPPDDESKDSSQELAEDCGESSAEPDAPAGEPMPDTPSQPHTAESTTPADGDADAYPPLSDDAFATASSTEAREGIADAKFDAGFPDIHRGGFEEHDDDDDAPGTLGAIEPIKTSRHIELNERRLKKMDDRIVMLTEPGSQFAEEYRSIRTSLLARWQNKRNLSHVITSATPQEGKTITSLNLGLTLAELRSRRTVIVEADLRLPAFAKLLKLEQGPGLVNYLRGEVTLEEATQRVDDDGVYLLAAGDRAFDDAVSLLSSSRMQALLEHLRQRFDHVVIDTPPVIELADAGVLGGLSDEVLLIARMRRTSSRLIEQAIQTLGSYNAPVGGVIATDHRTGFGRYYAYRYHYRYRYGYRSRYHDYRKSRKAA